MFRFVKDRLKTEDRIGGGYFGTVFPYKRNPNDRRWVVKKIHSEGWSDFLKSLSEVVYGFSCDHPSIVPVKGYYIKKKPNSESFKTYLKFSRMEQNLREDFKLRKAQGKPYSQKEILNYFYSLVCGIEYLHSKKIYHRDIKPDNLLFDDKGVLKIADIGIAKHVDDADQYQIITESAGTAQYSAPEIFSPPPKERKKSALGPADIWSLGVVMLELCVFDRKSGFNSFLPETQLKNEVDEFLKNIYEEHSSLRDLVKKMLEYTPNERPKIGEIKAELEKKFGQSLIQFEKSELQKQEQRCKDEIKLLEKQRLTSILLLIGIALIAFLLGFFFATQVLGYQQKQVFQESYPITRERSLSPREGNTTDKQGNIITERHLETFLKNETKVTQSETAEESQQEQNIVEEIIESQSDEAKLEKVISYLETSHEECDVDKQDIKDEHFIGVFKDLADVLEENSFYLDGLYIRCTGCKNLSSKTFVSFNAFTSRQSLSFLHFNLDHCDQLNNIAFKHLTKAISSQPVKDLSLRFEGWVKLTNEAFTSLTAVIQSKFLNSLSLSLMGCNQLNDAALKSLAKALSHQRLQNLYLYFSKIPEITDKGFENFENVISKSRQTLGSLYLIFQKTQVSEQRKQELKEQFSIVPDLYIP